MRPNNDEFIRLVQEAIAQGMVPPGNPVSPAGGQKSALRHACDVMGIHRDTGRKIWDKVNAPKPRIRVQATTEPAPIILPSERTILALRDEIATLKTKLKASMREDLSTERVRAQIFGLADAQPDPPQWLLTEHAPPGSPGVPVTIWSDWHWGEVVDRRQMGGVNEYNLTIAHERVRKLVDRTIDLCLRHMVNPDYPGIVICLGGDMISGEIHQELAETNEVTTMQTLVDLEGVLIWAITTMADHFGKVFLPCVVGNHGRGTMKPRAKNRTYTSFEWLLYTHLERHFKADDRVQFYIPTETDAHFVCYGHRYMLTHGDSLGVKGGDGIIGALGPIMRGAIKTRASEGNMGREYDHILMGHWHQLLWLPGCIVNSSLKGFDEYARLFLRARPEPPQQALWFSHPKRGPTFRVAVQVEDGPVLDDEWLTWLAV
jgi:hypothetical protein